MSVPIEVLRQMGLSPEQLARIEQESQKHVVPRSPVGDDLGSHLDRILNAPTGLSKFSTDPINRTSFLIAPAQNKAPRKWSFLSKSNDSLVSPTSTVSSAGAAGGRALPKIPGKENKRENSGIEKSGLQKKAKSSECLTEFSNPFEKPSAPTKAIKNEQKKPNEVPELYSPPQETTPYSPPQQQHDSIISWSEAKHEPTLTFQRVAFQKATIPDIKVVEKVQSPETVPIVVDQKAKQAKPYALQDLIFELGIEENQIGSPSSSLQVETDKYGSFHELKSAVEPKDDPLLSRLEVLSATQTEPIFHKTSGPLSCATDLSLDFADDPLYQSKTKPDFTPVLQSRFMSKYGDEMTASQATCVACPSTSCAELDMTSLVDTMPADGLQQYPLMSPSYTSYLRPACPPTSRFTVSQAALEVNDLNDPQISPLLNGVREEITANDKQLYLNYRNCMRNNHTSLPLSFQELKEKIEQYGLDIQFSDECASGDVKQLFLLPLNNITVPRWIPPSTSFRIGRGSNWFLTQTRVVSRNHCEIFHDIHSYYIKDVGSKSGTFVNGTRVGAAETISLPREIKHGDILQIGVDFSSEVDPFGHVPEKYRSGQCMALYGYKARSVVPLKEEIQELKPTERVTASRSSSKKNSIPSTPALSISDSKFERMSHKAVAQKSRLASANTKVYIEFGDYISDTSAGSAVLFRPDRSEASYAFLFNNYKFSWDISMTNRRDGSILGLSLGADGQYKIYRGSDAGDLRATITLQGDHKCLLEPVYGKTILEQEEMLAEQDLRRQSSICLPGPTISLPSAAPFVLASPTSPQFSPTSFLAPQMLMPSAYSSSQSNMPSPVHEEVKPRNPFYSLTGDLASGSLAFYVQRFQNCRKQIFLGEGQLSAKKSSMWGKKTIFYEARLPEAEQDDDLLALLTMFNVLNQCEKL